MVFGKSTLRRTMSSPTKRRKVLALCVTTVGILFCIATFSNTNTFGFIRSNILYRYESDQKPIHARRKSSKITRIPVVKLNPDHFVVDLPEMHIEEEPSIDRDQQKMTTRIPTSTSGIPVTIPVPENALEEELEIEENSNSSKYACTVPKLDAWDKSILHLIDHYKPKLCKKVQYDMMYLDMDNYLRLNETALSEMKLTANDVECVYFTIRRSKDEEDFQADIGFTRHFEGPTQMDSDTVQVNCMSKDENELLYGDVLSMPILDMSKNFTKNSEDVLNVIMLYIDSMSMSAAQRHMPKTWEYMTKEMGFNPFWGYNKIADNTFPNVIPMLTGKRIHDHQPDMLDEMREDYSMIYFDHWPLIWKNFSAKGYITTFNEEHPDMGLFHLKSYGFKQKPVDHYYVNFWKAKEWLTYRKTPTDGCMGNKTPAEVLLDIVRNHLNKFKDLAQFIYAYLIYPSHSDSSEMDTVDHVYFEFFKQMHTKQMFNGSMVMLISDHGSRHSIMRSTNMGLLEERLPMCMMYLPPWFYRKHPNILRNIRLNGDRLASNFDIYETMLDILKQNFGPDSKQRPKKSRGLSLLHPIPTGRSCKSAGIPFYFCTCQQMKWTQLPADSEMAKYATADFFFALNNRLEESGKCARWTQRRLLAAETMAISSEDAGILPNSTGNSTWINTTSSAAVIQSDVYKTNLQVVRVTVEGEVRGVIGKFQALMLFNQDQHQLSLHSDISRLDRYGNQSVCIGQHGSSQLKKLCVCRDYVLNSGG